MIATHLIATTSGLDLRSVSTIARTALAAASTLRVCTDRPATKSSAVLTVAPAGQDELLRLVSIAGAIRTNADAVPQSLRTFVA